MTNLAHATESPGPSDRERRRKGNQTICYGVAALFAGLGVHMMFFNRELDWTNLERGLALLNVSLTVLCLCSVRAAHRLVPTITNKRRRTTITAAYCGLATAALVGFMYLVLPRYTLTSGQVALAVLWAMFPLMICSVVCFAMDEAAYQKLAAEGQN